MGYIKYSGERPIVLSAEQLVIAVYFIYWYEFADVKPKYYTFDNVYSLNTIKQIINN